MPINKKKNQFKGNVFEQTVLHALNNVQNGSIMVIKQDNVIIQVNISENLNWTNSTGNVRPDCNRLRILA